MVPITALTASAFAVLYFMAAWAVIKLRLGQQVSMGDGGNQDLMRCIRAQANLAEYAPIGLLMLLCLELNGAPWWVVAIPAVLFLVGRSIHWHSFHRDDLNFQPRKLGMQLTLLSLLGLAGLNVLWVFI